MKIECSFDKKVTLMIQKELEDVYSTASTSIIESFDAGNRLPTVNSKKDVSVTTNAGYL